MFESLWKILENPEGKLLLNIKSTFNQFAIENEVHILDAGQSEVYGCKVSEFVDGHHALSSCYEKILPHFLEQRAKIPYGLIGPGF